MKLAIMQPYFFPYIGYFALSQAVDTFVVYDTAQFPKQGWVNRNRINSLEKGWEYITVPLKKASFTHSFQTPIKDVEVSDTADWRTAIKAKIKRYSPHAPHYLEVMGLINDALECTENNLSKLNVSCTRAVCEFVGLRFNAVFSSELGLQFDDEATAQDKVLAICAHFDASRYINLPGGRDLYCPEAFSHYSIQLSFLRDIAFRYDTGAFNFQPNLSIIDALMWNASEHVAKIIASYPVEHLSDQ